MKKTLSVLLALLFAISMGTVVFAEETDKTVDVFAKYEETSEYTVAVNNGSVEITNEDGTKVSVSDISVEAKSIVIIPVDEADTDAYAWFKDMVKDENIESAISPYAVYLYDENENLVSSEGATVTVPVPEGYTDPVVYAIDKDGNPTKLTADVKDGNLTFTSDGAMHFVVADEKENTPGTDPAPGTEPNDPDDPTPSDDEPSLGFLWWLIPLCVVTLGGGGFAFYWFVIKKKTWADLIAVFKKNKENKE